MHFQSTPAMAVPWGMNGGRFVRASRVEEGGSELSSGAGFGSGVRVLGVGGDGAAEGLDLGGLLLLGVPPLAHLLRRRRGGLLFRMD